MNTMQSEKMNNDMRTAFQKGYKLALKNRDGLLRIEHVIYGILTTNNIIHEIISKKVEDFDSLLNDIEEHNKMLSDNIDGEREDEKDGEIILRFESSLLQLIRKCSTKKTTGDSISVEIFFSACMGMDLQIIKKINDYGITNTFMQKKLKQLNPSATFPLDENYDNKSGKDSNSKSKSKTPILDNYSRDLTTLAIEGKLDPVIGRSDEIERVAQILGRRKKNNPILIGDPGVGKTAIVEGLALKIANNDCPRTLQGKRLVTLDLTAMVAGTKYRGEFESRIKSLMDEVRNNDDIILFIDEIHTMIGAGGASGSLDASNIFKPALARGELQCIGATTLDEYREHIEKDGALDRRFQKVMVDPPTVAETTEILNNIKNKYEDFHKVQYSDEAIEEIVRLADRYITNREFPDKALDIMDEAGSRTQITIKPPQKLKDLQEKINQIKIEKGDVVKLQNFEKAADLRDKEKKYGAELEKAMSDWKQSLEIDRTVIDENMIADVVSSMTGIPVSKVSQNEIKKLLEIDKELKNSIIGQDVAVQKVSAAIRRNRTGIRKKNKPIGSFLFIGTTGVGKTELAKRLAEKVFGSDEALIRFDMSEYSEKFTISKLIGAPPGYVGYEEGGQLTEKVKNKPYCVVLLDEIEKAHSDIFNILLQVLDEGHLTDGNGRKINFKNTLIIMTSNVGAKQAQDFAVKIGFTTKDTDTEHNAEDLIQKELKKQFKPEFLNRVDETVYFNQLSEENITEIIELQLNELTQRLLETNYTLKITDAVKKCLLTKGYDKAFGAREIQRTILKYVEDPISDELLREHMPKFADIFVDYDEVTDKMKIELTQ